VIYDYHVILGGIGVGVALVGYAFYIRSILLGETKPHIFTWLILGLIDGIVFVAQLVSGAGAGAWPLGISIIICSVIVALSVKRGEKRITASDWVFLTAALASIGVWIVMRDPLGAVIILTVINVFGTAPTVRKSFYRPNEESMIPWSLDIVRFILALIALDTFNLTTALFPAGIILTNLCLVTMVLYRRRQLRI